ncbi:MAG: AlpA family transcriptional regulator [Desulfobacterium sp.]|nr:AlpA family transcriptional regulator [Desulfobacterium sp.]
MKILRCKEVENKVGLRHTKLYMMMNEGTFPKPIRLGPRSVGWVESEIDEWLLEKIKERDQSTAAV